MCFWTLWVGATDCGAKVTRLYAMSYGAKVFITRLRWRRRGTYLGAIAHGAKLGATSYGAEVPTDYLAREPEGDEPGGIVHASQSPRRRAPWPCLVISRID